jgi:hypothetical protein
MGYPQQGRGDWAMGGVGQMGQMGMNPYMMQQGHPQMQGGMGGSQFQGQGQMCPGSGASSMQYDANGNELKPFDSAQMKQGRMGHYGYLEGRGEPNLSSRCSGLTEQNLPDRRSGIFQRVCNLLDRSLLHKAEIPFRPHTPVRDRFLALSIPLARLLARVSTPRVEVVDQSGAMAVTCPERGTTVVSHLRMLWDVKMIV